MKRRNLGRFTVALLAVLAMCLPILAQAQDGNACNHQWVIDAVATQPTCTEAGFGTYKCTVCGTYDRREIPANGHTPVTVPGRAATCTETGLTDGSKCSVCGTTLTAQTEIPAKGHTPETVPGRAATCTEAGLTDGSRCSVCGTVLSAQTEIPAAGHTPETIPGRAATCTEAGLTDGSRCSVCGTVLSAQTEIPANGHTPETVPGRAATCTEAGLTDGSRCSVCGTVLSAQTEIPAAGHSWDGGAVTTAATCTANGVRTYTCTRCGTTYTESIPATGHTPEVMPAVAPSCAAPGKTEGSRCAVCGTILTAQTDIPALEHQWGSWYTDREATCTENGQKFCKCLKCGALRWDDIPPLGHEWDEGTVIREAGYLEEGEITYTCLRDESHTKTEAIPVKVTPEDVSVMNLLRSGSAPHPESPEGADPVFVYHMDLPLHIAVQPEGGLIDTENGSLELSVEADGGTKPYTYEWHIKPIMPEIAGGLMDYLLSRWLPGILQTYEAQKQRAMQAVNAIELSQQGISFDLMPETTGTKTEQSPVLDFSKIVGDDRPTLTANEPGDYYCVVTDVDNNYVTSETVRVDYNLYIAGQPKNMNLYDNGKVTFECRAEGGVKFDTGTYIYAWYDAEGNQVSFSDQGTFTTSKEGEYYCMVQDFGDGLVTSRTVKAYKAPNVWIKGNGGGPIIPGETTRDLEMQFGGGVPPYTCTFTRDGEKLRTNIKEEEGEEVFTADELGTYTFTVTDKMGQTVTREINVYYRQLKIAEQPQGGTLEHGEDAVFKLSMTMAEGTAPFTYVLYHDGDLWDWDEYSPSDHCEFTVNTSGDYTIRAEDANGRWAISSRARVDDYKSVRISSYTDQAEFKKFPGYAKLTVWVRDGAPPYLYEWSYTVGNGDPYVFATEGPFNSKSRSIDVYRMIDTTYACKVTDGNGDTVVVENIPGVYVGKTPYFTKSPDSICYEYDSFHRELLTMEARLAEGDERPISYLWQHLENGEWRDYAEGDTLSLDGFTGGKFRGAAYAGSPEYITYGYEFDIMRDIIIEKAKQIGKSKKLEFRFNGGYGPYSVKVERSGAGDVKIKSKAPCLQTVTVEDHAIDVFLEIFDLYYKSSRKNEKGKWESVKVPYIIYVTVTDESTGRSATAEVTCDW